METPSTAAVFEEARKRSGMVLPDKPLTLDTTRFSPLHRLTRYRTGDVILIVKIYFMTVLVTYVPLALAAMLGPHPISAPSASVRLPFLYDWNIAFTFLVAFPSLVAFIITDDATLRSALLRIQKDGILIIPEAAAIRLRMQWEIRFGRINRAASVVGAVVATVIIISNVIAYSTPGVGFWVSIDGDARGLPVAIVFLICIGTVYACLPLYVIRSIAMTLFLNDVVGHAEMSMLPFHPDRCGGLRPVGRLGLRHQYLLSILGVNVVLLVFVSIRYLTMPVSLFALIAGVAIAYLMLGPVVFMGPLLSFRGGMLRAKAELLGEVAQRLRIELHRLRKELPSGQLRREDEELVDRLRKVGGVIDELPVWPVDAGTLRKFLTAYVLPVLGATSLPFLRMGWTKLLGWFNTFNP